MAKYNTMHQHQPLPVPRRWSGEEIRFATQLEEVLDDIYRIFNRMKLSDLAGDLTLTDKDGNTTVAISAGGDITAKSISADTVVIGGKTLNAIFAEMLDGRVIVSDTQPDAHGVVWIKPTTPVGPTGDTIIEEATFSGEPTISASGTNVALVISLPTKIGEVTAAQCKYHTAVRLQNLSAGRVLKRKLTGIRMTLTGTDAQDESQTVELMDIELDALLTGGDYITIDNEAVSTSPDYDNLSYGSSVTLTVSLTFSDVGTVRTAEQTTVRAYAEVEDQTGDAVKTCEVYYLS